METLLLILAQSVAWGQIKHRGWVEKEVESYLKALH